MIEADPLQMERGLRSLESMRIGLVVTHEHDVEFLRRQLMVAGAQEHRLSLIPAAGDALPEADIVILSEDCAALKLAELQQGNRLSDFAIVVLGTEADDAMALQFIESGAQDYLHKEQCRPQILMRTLLHALERHHLRARLARANRRLEKVISANADGCLVVTRKGVIAFANPAAEAMLSRSGKQLVGSQLGVPLVDNDYANIELLLPGCHPVMAELRVAEVDWEGEHAYLISLRDVTERRKLQQRELRYQARIKRLVQQLSESEAQERRRLARVLHDDVQHSLLSAKLALQALEGRLPDETLRHEASSVTNYIEEAINTSRTLTSELTPTVLDDRGLVAALRWLARLNKKRWNVSVEIDAEDGFQVSDAVLRGFIFQAARELLLNIVKHAQGATAKIRLRKLGDEAISIVVSDNGPGFDLALLDAEKSDVGGFGLFHIQQQVENLGGTLAIESSPRAGSRFAFTFATSQRETAREQADGPVKSRDKTRVLIIDDQRSFRFLFQKMLEKTGRVDVVGVAASGKEGLELTEQLIPDVVLCDVSLPDIEGPQLVRELVAAQPGLRVIACSMHEPEEMAEPMCEAGAEAYLRKDVSIEQFERAIRPGVA